MQNKKFLICLILLATLVLPESAFAKLGYSGRLVLANGTPVTGAPDLMFELFYSNDTLTPVGAQTLADVPLVNGVYTVELDFVGLDSIMDGVPVGETLMIRVTDVDSTLVYDFQNILQVPMAYKSEIASSASSIADTTVTPAKLDISGACADGQVISKNGAQFSCIAPGGGGVVTSVTATAGSAVTIAGTTQEPTVGVDTDGLSLETVTNKLQIKDDGVTPAKLAGGAAGSVMMSNNLGDPTWTMFGSCAAGSSIRQINNDGTVVCETDTDGTSLNAGNAIDAISLASGTINVNVFAGSGLTIASNAITRDASIIQSRVTGVCAPGSSVQTINQDGTVTCHTDVTTPSGAAGGDLTGTYPNPELKASGVLSGTYKSVTVDAKGIVTAGSNPNLEGSPTACTDGQVLEANTGVLVCATLPTSPWTVAGSDLYYNGGNVGIGTTAPTGRLSINGDRNQQIIQTQNQPMPDINSYDVGGIVYSDDHLRDSIPSTPAAFMKIVNVNTNPTFPTSIRGTDIEFGTADTNTGGQGVAASTKLIVKYNGNIGVGTSNPAAKLDVAGNIRATEICDEAGANCKDISTGWNGGSVTSVGSGTGLTGGPITTSGTLAVDVGTTANKIVQLDATAKLPAIDGSQLTNLPNNTTSTTLTGFVTGANTTITNTDTVETAFEKTQGQLNAKEPSVAAGTTAQYFRGDKSWQTLDKIAVGLGNVTNDVQIPLAYLDTDGTLTANSDTKVATQRAVKTYVDAATGAITSSQWTTSGSDIYYNSGNVGIGTTTPAAKLDITEGVTNTLIGIGPTINMALSSQIIMRSTPDLTGAFSGKILTGRDGGSDYNSFMSFHTESKTAANYTDTSTEKMRITSVGDVGIGTASPTAKFQVRGGSILVDGTAEPELRLNSSIGDAGSLRYTSGSQLILNNENAGTDLIRFQSNGSDRVTIMNTGNVGIGTSGPEEKLVVRNGSMRVETTSTGGGVAIHTNNAAGMRGAYRFGIDNLRLEKGLLFDRDSGRISLINDPVSSTVNERLSVLANGNVGVGTPNPGAKLNIVKAGNYNSEANSGLKIQSSEISPAVSLQMGADTTSNIGFIQAMQPAVSWSTRPLVLQGNGGNVGIGTITPAAKLDVAGNIRATEICDEAGANCKDISTGWGTGSVTSVASGTGLTGGPITSSGTLAVDVGTTAGKIVQLDGSSRLPAVDGSQLTNLPSIAASALDTDATLSANLDTRVASQRAVKTYVDAATGAINSSQWTTNGTNIYYNSGSIGIGTITPLSPLHIKNNVPYVLLEDTDDPNGSIGAVSSYNSGAMYYDANFNSSASPGAHYFRADGGTKGLMSLLNNGNVGIGTTTPSEKLEVSGNVRAVSFISTSDGRLKTNLQKVDGLETLKGISGYLYEWKNNGEEEYGVIAQDVEKVMPKAVVTNEETGIKAVKYNNLIAPIIEAIKELYAMFSDQDDVIKGQSREIASLKKKNQELESRLERLEKQMSKKGQ